MPIARLRRLLVVVAMAAGGFGFGAPSAGADCVSAEAGYRVLGGSEQYVLGPKQCVAPTPFDECVKVGPTYVGEPSIVWAEATVWLVCPV